MSIEQEETTKIVEPLTNYMEHKGWHVEKTHGSIFQQGFPDLYCMHPKYDPKWIECKVLRDGNIKFTPAQEKKFPLWIAHGARIWVIAGTEFRFTHGGKAQLERAYNMLFAEPNCGFVLNPKMRKYYL